MAPAERTWKWNFALSKVADTYRRLPSICGEIVAVQVGSIASDELDINFQDYFTRKNCIRSNSPRGLFDEDPVDAVNDGDDVIESDGSDQEIFHMGVAERSHSTNETTPDTIEKDDGSINIDINMGLDGEVDEDYSYETASPTSAEDYISEISQENVDGYPQEDIPRTQRRSPQDFRFFQAALKKEWAALRKGPIDLSDENPELFEAYVQWLYSQKVLIRDSHPRNHNTLFSLVQSHILGARLLDSKYQNTVMRTLILYADETKMYPHDGILRFAYDHTLPSSPLRKILIDFWVYKASTKWSSGDLVQQLGDEIANDLREGFMCRRASPSTTEWSDHRPPWMKTPSLYNVVDTKATKTGDAKDDGEAAGSDREDSGSVFGSALSTGAGSLDPADSILRLNRWASLWAVTE